MKCQQAQTRIIEADGDALPAAVVTHLEACEACRSFFAVLKSAKDAVPRTEPSPDLDRRILQAARLRGVQAQQSGRNAEVRTFSLRYSWMAAAAAALLAVFTAVLWTTLLNSPNLPDEREVIAWQDDSMEEEMMLIAAELDMLDLNRTLTTSTE